MWGVVREAAELRILIQLKSIGEPEDLKQKQLQKSKLGPWRHFCRGYRKRLSCGPNDVLANSFTP